MAGGPKRTNAVAKADKGQFDEVLQRMLRKNPQKTSEIHVERRKNPETDLRRLPIGVEPASPEVVAEVLRQKEFFAEHGQEAHQVTEERKKEIEAGAKKKKKH